MQEPSIVADFDLDSRAYNLRDSFNNERNEAYKDFMENDFQPVKLGEFSTFSIDVDTASYSTMRRFVIDMNQRPPAESVRLEEYINYFKYDYAQPTDNKPFATHVDVFSCPWESKHLLARIGIKGKEYSAEERPPLNLVFLIDVSGSMDASNRLPLVKRGLTELVEMLQPKDRVAIVTYAGDSRLVLPSVSGKEKRAILDSVNALSAGGSTNGAGGIKLAYETARKYYDKEAQNRVILCTDGDFNVGTTDNKTLEQMIGDEAKSGVFLTILGFGMGNYKDDRLKTLSMRGNGNYGYIDSLEECRKLLVEGLSGTLFAIAKDVKIQVDFNPAAVSGYRLLGYENRKLRDEDFHNDAVDAGEIGAGHTVTALYEIVPVGVRLPAAVDRSRYDTDGDGRRQTADGSREEAAVSPESDELMFVKLRYKEPDGDKSLLLEYPVKNRVGEANGDSKFASAVALYGMLLRSSRHSGNGSWSTVLELAVPNTKKDKYREEFIELVKKARDI
jgi:secreted protein with Ig-like and vWFA domain